MVDPRPYEVEDFVFCLLRKKWTCMFFMYGEAELYYLDWDPLTENNKRMMKEGYPAARNMGDSKTLSFISSIFK